MVLVGNMEVLETPSIAETSIILYNCSNFIVSIFLFSQHSLVLVKTSNLIPYDLLLADLMQLFSPCEVKIDITQYFTTTPV